MRILMILLAFSIATPTLAQSGGSVTAGHPATATSNILAPANAAPTVSVPPEGHEEIGYDPKSKRDPNGKVLNTPDAPAKPQTEMDKLRKDNNLRSDRDMLKRRNALAPSAQQATPSNASEAASSSGTDNNNGFQKTVISGGTVTKVK